MQWAEKVRILLQEQRWDERSLADASGVNYHTLRAALSSNKNMQVDNAIRIARALRVSAEWLFDDSEGMESIKYLSRPASEGERLSREIEATVRFLGPEHPDIPAIHGLAMEALRTQLDSHGTQPGAAAPQRSRQQRAS